MRRAPTSVFLALACLGASPPDPSGADVSADTTILVAADRERDQRMTVPVTIAGQGPFRFLVDTGSQATVIARQLLPHIALSPTGTAKLMGMASVAQVETVELDGLTFAGREINGLVAPLLEGSHIGADGIIGLDSLQDLRVTIDLRSDTLAVSPADDRGENNGYEIVVRARAKKGQLVITRARLDGVATAVIIDTGSLATVGNRALQQRLRAKVGEHLIGKDVNGNQIESRLGYARKLEIARMKMSDIPIAFADSPVFQELGLADQPAIILGMGNLRLFDRVAVDFAQRKVLFDLPRGTATY